jgi:hypothetical protein
MTPSAQEIEPIQHLTHKSNLGFPNAAPLMKQVRDLSFFLVSTAIVIIECLQSGDALETRLEKVMRIHLRLFCLSGQGTLKIGVPPAIYNLIN